MCLLVDLFFLVNLFFLINFLHEAALNLVNSFLTVQCGRTNEKINKINYYDIYGNRSFKKFYYMH